MYGMYPWIWPTKFLQQASCSQDNSGEIQNQDTFDIYLDCFQRQLCNLDCNTLKMTVLAILSCF